MLKFNKRYKILLVFFSFLFCFICLFAFLVPCGNNAFADENYPGDNLSNKINYLYDLDTITFTGQGNTLDVQFPRAIYPDKLNYLYSNNYNGYYNEHSMGTYVYSTGVESELPPVIDFQFSANTGTISSLGDFSLYKSNYVDTVSTPLYMSECLIPLPVGYKTNTGLSHQFGSLSLPCPYIFSFNDSLIPLGVQSNGGVDPTNHSLLGYKGFYVRLLNTTSVAYRLHVQTTYQYYYNTTDTPIGGGVINRSNFKLSPVFTSNRVFDSNSNGVAGGMVYNPTFNIGTVTGGSLNNVGSQYLMYANFDFFYRYLVNFKVYVGIEKVGSGSLNFRQISLTNYSYITDTNFGLTSVLDNTYVNTDFENQFNLGSFLGTAVGGFLEFEIFPGFSLTGLLALIIAIPLTISILKFFAGG